MALLITPNLGDYGFGNIAVSDGLIAYWPMDEDSIATNLPAGTQKTIFDINPNNFDPKNGAIAQGNGYNSANNTGFFADGRIGQAWNTNNDANGWFSLPTTGGTNGFAAASVSVWFNLTAGTSGGEAIYWQETSSSGFAQFSIFAPNPSGPFGLRYRDQPNDPAGSGVNVVAVNLPGNGVWTHFVATYDSANAVVTIWQNGKCETVAANAGAAIGNSTPNIRNIGIAPGNPVFNGLIDDLRLYNRVLSPDEILNLYRLGLEGRRSERSFFSILNTAQISVSSAKFLTLMGVGT